MIVDTFPNGLRPLQIQGGIRCYTTRGIVLADQPGAGKTAQIEFALELDGQFTAPESRVLITAPKTACQLMWARELTERVAGEHDVVIADLTGPCGGRRKVNPSMARRNAYLGEKMLEAHDRGLPLIVLTNFEGLRWGRGKPPVMDNLWHIRWTAVVIDESHLVLPTTTDDERKMTLFWRGLDKLVIAPRALRIAVSGTPDNGKLENRYGTYRFIQPGRFRDYWSWVKYFFETKRNPWGGVDILYLKPAREADWNAVQAELMIRRTKAEMLEGLEPKQFFNIELELRPELRDRLDAFEEELAEKVAALEARDDELARRELQSLGFTARTRLRQLAVTDWYADQDGVWHPKGDRELSAHLDWICEFLTERGHHPESRDDEGGKVVITGYLVEELKWLQEQLEAEGFGRVPILSGDTPLEEKQRIEHAFQRGSLRAVLFSGHIGVSISLDAADDMVFVDIVHDPDKLEQTEDRIHRASSKGVKSFWRLIGLDTAQQEILRANDSRYRVTRKSYDGSRGVDIRRKMLKISGGEAA